jgi:hypothetical protein
MRSQYPGDGRREPVTECSSFLAFLVVRTSVRRHEEIKRQAPLFFRLKPEATGYTGPIGEEVRA